MVTTGLFLWVPVGAHAQAPQPSEKPEIISAQPLDAPAEEIIKREMTRAKQDGKVLIVYVGAPWCEPCVRFKAALKAGQLDGAFPKMRLLDFDRTRDEARLERAGYLSRLIPLFAIPDKSGRASDKQIEGSIKGPGAIGNIVPRLRRLLQEPTP
jgi:thiol-disulfide isomerase/thioredoxin